MNVPFEKWGESLGPWHEPQNILKLLFSKEFLNDWMAKKTKNIKSSSVEDWIETGLEEKEEKK